MKPFGDPTVIDINPYGVAFDETERFILIPQILDRDIWVYPLAAPVLGRVIAMLAARADFSLEGISEAQLVTDSLAANVPRVIVGANIQLGIDSPPEELVVRVGPLQEGGANRIMDASALGDLPPVLERLTKEHQIEGSPDGEILSLTLVNPA